MGAFRFIGMAAMIYTGILLAVSFFVLLANHKSDTKGLKMFGYAVAVYLCVAAAVMLICGIYVSIKGRNVMPMHDMMMRGEMQEPMMRR